MLLPITSRAITGFDPGSYKPDPITNADNAIKIGNIILSIINVVGVVVSVVILVIIGIKYMLGSVQEKAEYKQSMIPYLIGAVLLFSSSNLPAIKKGLSLWANSVVPSLFPFFVATELLMHTNLVNLFRKYVKWYDETIF